MASISLPAALLLVASSLFVFGPISSIASSSEAAAACPHSTDAHRHAFDTRHDHLPVAPDMCAEKSEFKSEVLMIMGRRWVFPTCDECPAVRPADVGRVDPNAESDEHETSSYEQERTTSILQFDISVPAPQVGGTSSQEEVIFLHEYPMNDETGGSLWDGAVVLAKYLEHRSQQTSGDLFRGKNVLELGSGTGLVGLAAAKLGAKKAVLTEIPPVRWLAELNIRSNFPDFVPSQGGSKQPETESGEDGWSKSSDGDLNVDFSLLDWRERWKPEDKYYNTQWDFILASDVVWVAWLVPPFVETLQSVARENTVVYLAHQTRSEMVDKKLWELVDKAFDRSTVPFEELHPGFRDHMINVFRLVKK